MWVCNYLLHNFALHSFLWLGNIQPNITLFISTLMSWTDVKQGILDTTTFVRGKCVPKVLLNKTKDCPPDCLYLSPTGSPSHLTSPCSPSLLSTVFARRYAACDGAAYWSQYVEGLMPDFSLSRHLHFHSVSCSCSQQQCSLVSYMLLFFFFTFYWKKNLNIWLSVMFSFDFLMRICYFT